MNGDERREEILRILCEGHKPLSGTVLSERFKVSRQVIVQDIALLRACNKNILATNKGYLYFEQGVDRTCKRAIRVKHKDEDIQDEFYTIVDLGASILDVVVEHEIYGQITVDLIINNREDADTFVQKCQSSSSKTLNILTQGVHYHTIEAGEEEILDKIELLLHKKGYLHTRRGTYAES